MSILFYSPWNKHINEKWLTSINYYFRKTKVYTLKDNPDLSKIEFCIIWELDDKILKKLKNVKILFSMGAGVDHILNLKNYNNQPIIRVKDPFMSERMTNHVLSQILFFQLNLRKFQESQKKKIWHEEIEPILNRDFNIGIYGLGYLGSYVGKKLKSLGYNVSGFKNSKPKKKYSFPVFYNKNNLKKFLHKCDVVVCIIPSTIKNFHIINTTFFQSMKKNALLINVGRGATLNEKSLISHMKKNDSFYASLDVFEQEPLDKNSPLWYLNNLTITPHVASLTYIDSAVQDMHKKVLKFKKNGKIQTDVNKRKGY